MWEDYVIRDFSKELLNEMMTSFPFKYYNLVFKTPIGHKDYKRDTAWILHFLEKVDEPEWWVFIGELTGVWDHIVVNRIFMIFYERFNINLGTYTYSYDAPGTFVFNPVMKTFRIYVDEKDHPDKFL